MAKTQIDYFTNTEEKVLKRLYYRCQVKFYEHGQKLFEQGEHCDDIFIILSGVIDIILWNGKKKHLVLDYMGRGSIIGINSVLKGEKFLYEAINNCSITATVLKISAKELR